MVSTVVIALALDAAGIADEGWPVLFELAADNFGIALLMYAVWGGVVYLALSRGWWLVAVLIVLGPVAFLALANPHSAPTGVQTWHR
jgi:cell division protein FtsW (lipid II flippase)